MSDESLGFFFSRFCRILFQIFTIVVLIVVLSGLTIIVLKQERQESI